MHVDWYATVLRQDLFAAEVSAVAPLALRYGATQYSVHRSRDDRYKITQMAWFERSRAGTPTGKARRCCRSGAG